MVCASDFSSHPPLHRAAALGDVTLVETLLVDFDPSESFCSWRPIEWACRYGQVEVVRFLLDHGADGRVTGEKDDYYYGEVGPIHLAVVADSLPLVELLLARGVPVDEKSVLDVTPLHLARSAKMAHFLIPLVTQQTQWGIEARDIEGLTPLHCAASEGRRAVVRCLLDAHAAPQDNQHDSQSEFGRQPLHRAARKRHLGCCDLLLKAGAEINAPQMDEGTALDEALTYAKWCDANRHISLAVFVAWMLQRGATSTKFSRHEIMEMVALSLVEREVKKSVVAPN